MELTHEVKDIIDGMTYREMLERWRYTPAGDPLFTGESGQYFAEAMSKRRENLEPGVHAAISRLLALREGLK
jgi:hypothetical protein